MRVCETLVSWRGGCLPTRARLVRASDRSRSLTAEAKMRRTMVVFVTLVANLAWWSATAFGQSEGWPRLALVPVVAGIDQPTHIANAGDGTGRLFFLEQA